MKMHKLVGKENPTTMCPAWLGPHDGYWATRWWKYVTCKRCLKLKGCSGNQRMMDIIDVKRVLSIMAKADGGCPPCVSRLAVDFYEVFPEWKPEDIVEWIGLTGDEAKWCLDDMGVTVTEPEIIAMAAIQSEKD